MATTAGILEISSKGTFQYLPGRYPWGETELEQLNKALQEFPEGSYSGSQRYIMIASRIPTKTVRDVVVRLRQHKGNDNLSGLIDTEVEKTIKQKFSKSLEFLNHLRKNLLAEQPQFAQNEEVIRKFIQNSKDLFSQLQSLPVQMPKLPLKLKSIEPKS